MSVRTNLSYTQSISQNRPKNASNKSEMDLVLFRRVNLINKTLSKIKHLLVDSEDIEDFLCYLAKIDSCPKKGVSSRNSTNGANVKSYFLQNQLLQFYQKDQ